MRTMLLHKLLKTTGVHNMIIGQKFNTKMFFFDKKSGNFSQEISSLGYGPNGITSQLFDDACDEGFVMVSDRTKAEVPFYLTFVETDAEDEIVCWNFKSAPNTSNQPHLENLSVTIFND